NENSIRLLHLEPDFDGAPLKGSLSIHDFDGQFPYNALYYVWGAPDFNKSLSIDKQELRITHNLHAILRHLRYPDRMHTLWIDAICINQQDRTEKGPQVALNYEAHLPAS
ncbi:heterokaryon incompatibility protein-domain-containing protein, partial [Leptodontidium sp. MPI-SDFR-AT-0119]